MRARESMTCLHRLIIPGLEALAKTRLLRIVPMEEKGYHEYKPASSLFFAKASYFCLLMTFSKNKPMTPEEAFNEFRRVLHHCMIRAS